ncbi:PEP-CTERM sorting domain-containing protein [uncultured Thiohalocapsa sp.]|uniref:PEP-CTERM sorting domain-containing protein n=1 Tax=uncultured Thiohalocapsa sp. TaxID=768990 RepID=UPI0025F651CF|nr:PEP-CTERM sorting domain-containing protein [uncultured Thiohalocapsa sp.]
MNKQTVAALLTLTVALPATAAVRSYDPIPPVASPVVVDLQATTDMDAASTEWYIHDFTGPYDVANWTILAEGNGSVDTSGAPDLVTLIGSNSGTGNPLNVDFVITAIRNAAIEFDWSYITQDLDGPVFDPFGYVVNGVFTRLTDNTGPDSQSGHGKFYVEEGDIFGFRQATVDDLFGGATTEISNFKVIPAPASAILLLAGLGALALRRRSKLHGQERR